MQCKKRAVREAKFFYALIVYCKLGKARPPVLTVTSEPFPSRWETVLMCFFPDTLGKCLIATPLAIGHEAWYTSLPPAEFRWTSRGSGRPGEDPAIEKHFEQFKSGDTGGRADKPVRLAWAVETIPPHKYWGIAYKNETPPFNVDYLRKITQKQFTELIKEFTTFTLCRTQVYAVDARGEKFQRLIQETAIQC